MLPDVTFQNRSNAKWICNKVSGVTFTDGSFQLQCVFLVQNESESETGVFLKREGARPLPILCKSALGALLLLRCSAI